MVGVELKDEKGNLNRMLSILADGQINLNYIYSFVVIRDGSAPVMVFSTDDMDRAGKILLQEGVRLVSDEEL